MKITFDFQTANDAAEFVHENLVHAEDYANLDVLNNWNKTLISMRQGWPEGASVVSDILYELSLNDTKSIFKKDPNQTVNGLFFDVGLFCANIPEYWIDSETNPDVINLANKQRTIRIGFNSVALGFTLSSILERGAAVIALAYILQQMGHAVSVTQYYATTKQQHTFQTRIVHNPNNQPIDIDLMAFWLACPDSFFKCWGLIFKDLHKLNNPTIQCPLPVTEYGKEDSDIFIPGAIDHSPEWTRKDSIEWIHKTIQEHKNILEYSDD